MMVKPDLRLLDPIIQAAYAASAEKNVLAALNPDVFFGYFSACADGIGHGGNTTYPGLDWGQTLDALLWLGRTDEVLASWNYVRSFLADDGHLPFAIWPSSAGMTLEFGIYKMPVHPNGGIYRHWCPGDPFRTLPNTTFVMAAVDIFRHTQDHGWLFENLDSLRLALDYLVRRVNTEGLVEGAGYYLERPVRAEYDGINQCYTAYTFGVAAELFDAAGKVEEAGDFRRVRERIVRGFQKHFWAGDQCVEYIHPERGAIYSHGLTDVDWAAIAMAMLQSDHEQLLWDRLRNDHSFYYDGMPTGIATLPEKYEDWETLPDDRHDLAAMGRVWYLEAWARYQMGDTVGLLKSLSRVAARGMKDGGYWRERYYSESTGDLGSYTITKYLEYPANLIRIVHRFVLRTIPGFLDTNSLRASPQAITGQ